MLTISMIVCLHVYVTNDRPAVNTVLARLYAPPFCIVVQQKRGGGGRLIEFCTYASSLHPPPTPRNVGFRVAVSLVCYCTGYLPNNQCTKTTSEVEGKGLTGCSLCLHFPRQDKSPGKADRHISEHKIGRLRLSTSFPSSYIFLT